MKNSDIAGQGIGLVRIAVSAPKLKVGDVSYNTAEILRVTKEASASGVAFLTFPELCLTGYTAADLFHQGLLQDASLNALVEIAKATAKLEMLIAIGLPLSVDGKLYNVAAIISRGEVLGIIPKTYIPGYKEFYEERWFAGANDLAISEIKLFGKMTPIGTDLLFRASNNDKFVLGVEICEDLWAPIPPSSYAALAGATVVANLSASNELVGKSEYRRNLVVGQSARLFAAYAYVSSGVHESTTDVVFGGHSIIAETGSLLAESKRFLRESSLTVADIDLEHIDTDRQRTTSFGEHERGAVKSFRSVWFDLASAGPFNAKNVKIARTIDPHPFIPANPLTLDKRVEEIFAIQSAGLAKRLEHSGIKKIVLGLSGGLDSTLAVLVAVNAFKLLDLPLKNILAYTMPGFATSDRTKGNAWKLAEALGISIEEIGINAGVTRHLKDISHDGKTQDLTYENAQARYRTLILMDKANQQGGLVLGTGDLSEIALGWCTFNGDHMSQYNVNASIPKTLVRHLVSWVAERPEFASSSAVLKDIVDTPVSPELTVAKKGQISQKTEDIIGPYELHDFFLYHFLRWGSRPSKIFKLATFAKFNREYSRDDIKKWLTVFVKKFFNNQWKRSVMPDGPKVGSVALSPRGDWRMPSDGEVAVWLKDLETIK